MYDFSVLHCPVCCRTLVEYWKNGKSIGWECGVCARIFKMDKLKDKIMTAESPKNYLEENEYAPTVEVVR